MGSDIDWNLFEGRKGNIEGERRRRAYWMVLEKNSHTDSQEYRKNHRESNWNQGLWHRSSSHSSLGIVFRYHPIVG